LQRKSYLIYLALPLSLIFCGLSSLSAGLKMSLLLHVPPPLVHVCGAYLIFSSIQKFLVVTLIRNTVFLFSFSMVPPLIDPVCSTFFLFLHGAPSSHTSSWRLGKNMLESCTFCNTMHWSWKSWFLHCYTCLILDAFFVFFVLLSW
jgi:hypothetical protein